MSIYLSKPPEATNFLQGDTSSENTCDWWPANEKVYESAAGNGMSELCCTWLLFGY